MWLANSIQPLWLGLASSAHPITAPGGVITLDILVLIGAAAITAILLQRLGLAVIPGYFVAGALIGPSGFALIAPGPVLENASHFAVVLLMFGIGLHLDITTLRRELAPMLTAGLGAVLIGTLLLWPGAMLFGLPAPAALAVAMALSLSSTAVVLRILTDRHDLHRPHGRLSLAILIVQDMLVIAMLAAIPLLAQWNGISTTDTASGAVITDWNQLLINGLVAVLFIGLMIAAGIWLLPRLIEEAARGGSHELLTILGLAVALGAAYTTQRLGFSAELGAFLGGVILSTNPFRHQIVGRIAGLRDLFMAVFFTAIGMTLAWHSMRDDVLLIIAAATLLTLIKTIAIGLSAWAIGTGPGTSLVIGLSLAQAGEFSLLVIHRSQHFALIDERVTGLVTAVIVVSLIFTPAAIILAHRLSPYAARRLPRSPWMRSKRLAHDSARPLAQEDATQPTRPPLAVVAGFGTIGQHVAESLRAASVRCLIVELNAFTVRAGLSAGRNMLFGDISDPEVLESARIRDASVLVLTIPDDQAAVNACRLARAMSPDITIITRTHFPSSGRKARQAGADVVIVDELATAHDIQNALRNILGAHAVNATPVSHVETRHGD